MEEPTAGGVVGGNTLGPEVVWSESEKMEGF